MEVLDDRGLRKIPPKKMRRDEVAVDYESYKKLADASPIIRGFPRFP